MSDSNTVCFVCGNAVSFDDSFGNPDEALSGEICADFGSEHDGFYGQIYVCDECFSERIGRVVGLKNYIDGDESDDEVVNLAEKVVQMEAVKLQHPSNYGFWKNIQSNQFGE